MSGLLAGLLQPLTQPAHALALLALGLLIGQQRARCRMWLLLTLACGLAAGLAAIAFGVAETPAGNALLAAAALTGVLVALARELPALTCALLTAVSGAALGLDSPPQGISIAIATMTLVGTALGASLAVAIVATAAARLAAQARIWPRTAVRVLGSWVAASAVLGLALRLARGQLF
jgi:hydrogenase/urease accessory protein HupE